MPNVWSACRAAQPVSESQGPGWAQARPARSTTQASLAGLNQEEGCAGHRAGARCKGGGWGRLAFLCSQSLGGGMLAWSLPLPNPRRQPSGGRILGSQN